MGYFGNKRNECANIYDEIKNKLDEVDFIVEPFCGTSAISYYISIKHPKKFKYILNDNNKHLIECYKIFKDKVKLNSFIDKINELRKDLNKEKYLQIINTDTVEGWFIKSKIYAIRPGLYPIRDEKRFEKDFNYLLDTPIIDFLRNEDIEFLNDNAINILNMYKDNKKALIILDPPYVQCNNDFYLDSDTNIYEFLCINNIDNMVSNIFLILENNWIIRLLFKNNIKNEYNKKYQGGSKKKTSHLLISNF